MKFLYAYRGWILGVFAVVLLAMPPMPLEMLTVSDLLFITMMFVVFVLVRIQARRTIGEHTRGFKHDADRLVTEGIYSRMRHPLYLSNTGIAYSFIVLHLGFTLYAIPFVVFLVLFEVALSKMEDHYLEKCFGEQWKSWAAKTHGFFPSLKRIPVDTGAEDSLPFRRRSFLQAFCADRSTWIWLALIIFLILLRKIW